MARRLKSLHDLRRYMSSLINRLEAEKVDPSIAGRLGYLANVLKSVIERSDLEKRVDELEKLLKRESL